MVDVIRFYIKDIELSEEALRKFDGFRKTRNNKEICYYKKMNNDQVDDNSDEVGEREFDHFSIAFVRDKKETKGKLWFEQNIRRSYFARTRAGKNNLEIVMSDLHYNDFIEEINYWADELNIDIEDFWKAKVTQVELGVTLHFRTPMKGISSCFGSLKNMPRKHVYENLGVKFIGKNYQVSIYDKLDRAFYTGELFEKQPAIKRNILKEGAKKVKAYIRYEIKIKTVSGILPKDFGNLDHLEDIKDRWDELTEMLLNKFDDFTFVDVLSPEIEKYIIHEQIAKEIDGITIRGRDKGIIDEYLKYLGLKFLRLDLENTGIDEFNQYIIPFLKRDKIKLEKHYNDLYEKFRKKSKPSYSEKFKDVLSKRLKSIRLENIEKTE